MPALYFTPSSAIDYISHQERFLLDFMFLLRYTDRIRNVFANIVILPTCTQTYHHLTSIVQISLVSLKSLYITRSCSELGPDQVISECWALTPQDSSPWTHTWYIPVPSLSTLVGYLQLKFRISRSARTLAIVHTLQHWSA